LLVTVRFVPRVSFIFVNNRNQKKNSKKNIHKETKNFPQTSNV